MCLQGDLRVVGERPGSFWKQEPLRRRRNAARDAQNSPEPHLCLEKPPTAAQSDDIAAESARPGTSVWLTQTGSLPDATPVRDHPEAS
ncbi:Hypp2981 [Branchiostoma lanceolatum]|uniref:Hypp2981 protein n=1 Tax=Branchiostoma lanceolatum TaxID=7740 RepID=A0A8J9ZY79_BRALA|nr:Hypp2981 [Branchiostoma lanceolatum]